MNRDSVIDILSGAAVLVAAQAAWLLLIRPRWGYMMGVVHGQIGAPARMLLLGVWYSVGFLVVALVAVLATRTMIDCRDVWRRLSPVAAVNALSVAFSWEAFRHLGENLWWDVASVATVLRITLVIYAMMWVTVWLVQRCAGPRSAPARPIWRRPGVLLWTGVLVVAVGLQIGSRLGTRSARQARELEVDTRAHLAADDLDAALDTAEKAVEVAPDRHRTWWMLGGVRGERGEYAEAEQAYRKALELAPDEPELHYAVGMALYEQDEMTEAIPHLQKALKLDPEHASASLYLGGALASQHEFEEAARMYRRTLEREPNDVYALLGLAAVLTRLNRAEEAVTFARRAVQLEPEWAEARSQLAAALRAASDVSGAVRELEVAIDLEPADYDLRDELIETLVAAGRLDEALREAYQYQVAITRDGWADDGAQAMIAWVHAHRGERDEAYASLPGAGHGGHENVDHWRLLVLAQLGRTGDAVRVAEDMVNRDPDSSGAFEGLTLALAARGRWRDAVEAAEEALELQERLPATTEAALALALAKLDETDRAREHLQAVESDIHTPGAWIDIPYFAGLAYRELGETERSDELFRRAIDRWPKHPWSQKMREMM